MNIGIEMSTYLFKNRDTKEEIELDMSISERDAYIDNNPHMEQLVNGFPGLGHAIVRAKPDHGFRDVLKDIKKNHTGITTKPQIDCW